MFLFFVWLSRVLFQLPSRSNVAHRPVPGTSASHKWWSVMAREYADVFLDYTPSLGVTLCVPSQGRVN